MTLDSWRVFDGVSTHPAVFEAWNGLWDGLAAMEGVRLVVTDRLDLGDATFRWEVRPPR